MQQRFGLCGIVKIATLVPDREVGDKSCAGGNVLAQLLILASQQHKPAQSEACAQYQEQCWKYALHSATIEFDKTEAVAIQAGKNDRGDEKTRDDEEDIYTSKATPNQIGKCMKADY